jgi:hypothetical protein
MRHPAWQGVLSRRAHDQGDAPSGRRALRALVTALALFAATSIAVPAIASAAAGPASGDGIVPTEVSGNPTCPSGLFELKVEPPVDGTYTLGSFSVSVDVRSTTPGQVFDFSANMGVDQVIVKGGPGANAYLYSPEDKADTGLHAPVNSNNNKYFDLSHISFCVDFELQVSKTAGTTFTRTYEWSIAKSHDQTGTVELAPGQSHDVNYDVTVDVAGQTDSDWAVSGTIAVTNPAHVAASGVTVEDVVSPAITASVDCNGAAAGTGVPATIAPGGTLNCTYTTALPDGTSRTNTATADSTTTGIHEGSGTAAVTFGDPTNELDECITVTDDKVDLSTPATLGTACVTDTMPKTFSYTNTFGPFPNECATHTLTNTAAFKTNDQERTDTATSTVTIAVKCVSEGGCTLTQGYWKTHSEKGPAPYDDTWALLGFNGADTQFLTLSGVSWYDVFWSPPAGGNAYLILAHQYAAAYLNTLNGASVPSQVQTALTQAAGLLDNYTAIPAAKSLSKVTRDQMIALAGTLGSYNEGAIGPGHCTEAPASST